MEKQLFYRWKKNNHSFIEQIICTDEYAKDARLYERGWRKIENSGVSFDDFCG